MAIEKGTRKATDKEREMARPAELIMGGYGIPMHMQVRIIRELTYRKKDYIECIECFGRVIWLEKSGINNINYNRKGE
jgi:hypothetical protein